MVRGTSEFTPSKHQLLGLYQDLLSHYGPQSWWPADTSFEIAVGAILTQNTNWENVELALAQLRRAKALNLKSLLLLPCEMLERLIRPAGYYRLKARRLRNLCEFLYHHGGMEGLSGSDVAMVREQLLAVNGVGPETADDIILYGLKKPVFVIDTYTRRLLSRMRLATGKEPYEVLRHGFEHVLPADAALFAEYHALIVQHAKAVCRKQPRCADCAIRSVCLHAGSSPI